MFLSKCHGVVILLTANTTLTADDNSSPRLFPAVVSLAAAQEVNSSVSQPIAIVQPVSQMSSVYKSSGSPSFKGQPSSPIRQPESPMTRQVCILIIVVEIIHFSVLLRYIANDLMLSELICLKLS